VFSCLRIIVYPDAFPINISIYSVHTHIVREYHNDALIIVILFDGRSSLILLLNYLPMLPRGRQMSNCLREDMAYAYLCDGGFIYCYCYLYYRE
jgi:hypothetical protein